MKRVRFLKTHLMYQPGETAGFSDAVAATLIAAGVAIDPEAQAKAEAEAAAQAEADAKAKAEAEAKAEAKSGKKG
ncbi:hypothetical protein [Pontitalea aquivivens]|uniref:hypothetical protein n=1 Tax=Pontitalea aquivivens TaxID=3388663 RepID=UPI003970B053